MWAPVYDIAKLGPQLGMARPEGLSLKTRSARMEPVALQQTDAWGRDRFLGPSWLAGVGKTDGVRNQQVTVTIFRWGLKPTYNWAPSFRI